MIARLWWKEARTLWPAWPVLFGAGLGLQWVLLASGADGVRSGFLLLLALCWATLYAFVAASAAFAGERETGTLGLLDALPVDRRTLWLGKATFALATTLGLALVMLIVGALGTTEFRSVTTHAALNLGTLLFEAVAWGLLWSAFLRNPMAAGGLAVCSVGLVSALASGGGIGEYVADRVIPARLAMAVLALAASAAVVVGRPLAGWSPRFLDEDGANTPADRATPIRPRPVSPTRVLMWKARREGRSVWFGATAAGLGALALLFLNGVRTANLPAALLAIGAALVAGVGVFGGETSKGSQRFLLHLGVGPGPIWSRKMRAWGNALAVIALVPLVILSFLGLWNGRSWPWTFADWSMGLQVLPSLLLHALPSFAPIMDAFAIGILAGMVFRRRITAGMIAVLGLLVIAPVQYYLAIMGMLPPMVLLLTPIALLVISRAWAGDWLDERPGPARWLRLAGFVALPSIVFPTAYIANRAWGVPDPGPVAVAAHAPLGISPSDSAAISTYRRLEIEVGAIRNPPMPGISVGHLDPGLIRNALGATPDLVDRVHRAAEMPPFRLGNFSPGGKAYNTDPNLGAVARVAWFLDFHGHGVLGRGDLSGAWADILAEYRMARQVVTLDPSQILTVTALTADRQATMLALDWAAHGEQTPDLLRQALADLQALPPLPTLADVLKVEGPILDRTFDLPGAELQATIHGGAWKRPIHERVFENLLVYPWWERERARRICRIEFAALIAASDSGKARVLSNIFDNQHRAFNTRRQSPLTALTMPIWMLPDQLARAETGRQGLVQVIALRAWNLAHDGTYPESLDALVPDLLNRLPLDPYSARPFGYVRSKGQKVAKLDLQFQRMDDGSWTRSGQWLLFSVGPNGRQEAETMRNGLPIIDDLVFPLP